MMRIVPLLVAALALAASTVTAQPNAAPARPRVDADPLGGGDSVTATGLVLHRDPEKVRVVTEDISRFWRAVDVAAGKDSVERVRLFRTVYLEPGTVGLRDFMELKGIGRRLPKRDSVSAEVFDSALVQAAAVEMARATARWPRYYAGLRANLMALDTSKRLRAVVLPGLRRMSAIYPPARYPDLYVVVGSLRAGGTASSHGMLLAAEVFSRAPDTPLGELDASHQLVATIFPAGVFPLLALHETVHFLQPPERESPRQTNLELALREGSADFLAELVSSPWRDVMPYQRYGRAHEAEVWRAFARELHAPNGGPHWFYNYTAKDNNGAPDLGYWIGYRIAQEFYAHAVDKRAAVRELLTLSDVDRILRESRYADSFGRTNSNERR